MKFPKISICIPVFNGAAYVVHAIESAMRQTYQDFELVVVDNCSTDSTLAIIQEMSANLGGKLRLYKNDSNLGLAGNLNKCLEYANGEYIKLLLVDDLLLPDCLTLMAKVLDQRSSVALVCGKRLIIDDRSNVIAEKSYSPLGGIFPGAIATSRCLYEGNFIGEPTAVMFRKVDLKNGFSADFPQLMDMAVWFQLLERGDLFNITGPVCAIRVHEAQMTTGNVKSGRLVDDNVRLFEEFSKKSYIKATLSMVLKHRVLMTHRVWVSRKAVSEEKRQAVLSKYGSRFWYLLMPVITFVLALKRRFSILGGYALKIEKY